MEERLSKLEREVKRLKRENKADKPKVKRPLSGYMKFGNSIRPKLKEENPNKKVTEIMKMIGTEWKKLSAEDQAAWKTK